ncbi:hypothetical protein SAMN05660350_04256 [Geodermatophilus obscurus]|uniref:Uncharacterized protein n=1 Tax=Geodermatophilus obscurus TaxID=1861 RepID=A0A1M7UXU8_9ACTN|nr:hypothetical protein [Geodermatophilus obscurus]SHN87861.1 hypothetical protein SAMN05660350_04256 [Geodermatophilus obscurus]
MSDRPLTASIEVTGPADTDAQEMDELAHSLRQDLLDVDGIDDARPATAGPAPTGTKAGEALQVGALAVSMAPVALQGVIDVVRHWSSRRPVRKVSVTIGDDTLTLEGATVAQQEQLVAAFLDRHGDRGE